MTRIYGFALISNNASTYSYHYILSILYRYIWYNDSLFSRKFKVEKIDEQYWSINVDQFIDLNN